MVGVLGRGAVRESARGASYLYVIKLSLRGSYHPATNIEEKAVLVPDPVDDHAGRHVGLDSLPNISKLGCSGPQTDSPRRQASTRSRYRPVPALGRCTTWMHHSSPPRKRRHQ